MRSTRDVKCARPSFFSRVHDGTAYRQHPEVRKRLGGAGSQLPGSEAFFREHLIAMRRGRAARPISRRIPSIHAIKPVSVHAMKPLPSAPLCRYCAQIDPFLSFTAAFDTLCRSTEPSGFLKRLMMSQTLWAIVPGVGSVTLFRVTLTPRFLARISSPLSILSIIRRTSSGWESPPQRVSQPLPPATVQTGAHRRHRHRPLDGELDGISCHQSFRTGVFAMEDPKGSRGDATGPGGGVVEAA